MASKGKNYFGLPWLVALIVHFFLGWILSFVWRLLHGKNIILTILSLPFLLGILFWWVDFFSLLLHGKLKWLI